MGLTTGHLRVEAVPHLEEVIKVAALDGCSSAEGRILSLAMRSVLLKGIEVHAALVKAADRVAPLAAW